jgi:hypothetical protein
VDALKFAICFLCACTNTSIEKTSVTTAGAASSAITINVQSVSGDGALSDATLDLLVDGAPAVLGGSDALQLVDGLGGVAAFTGDSVAYEAKLATADAALAIELVRNGAVDRTIPIPLPPAFTPSAPKTASRAAGITLTWAVSAAFPMTILAKGPPCIADTGFTAHLEPDTGAFEIQPADLITVPGACVVTITMTRGLGRVQTRTVTVSTTP